MTIRNCVCEEVLWSEEGVQGHQKNEKVTPHCATYSLVDFTESRGEWKEGGAHRGKVSGIGALTLLPDLRYLLLDHRLAVVLHIGRLEDMGGFPRRSAHSMHPYNPC